MSKVSVYTTHYLKPEFVYLQKSYLDKWCMDDYSLVVINNGKDQEISNLITNVCNQLGLEMIEVENKSSSQFCSQSHAVALERALPRIKDCDSELKVIMDCDIFPFRKFSFYDIIRESKLAGLYQQRKYGDTEHEYLSAIFTIFHRDLDLTDFSFHSGVGDTGSGTGKLMKSYPTQLVNHTPAIDIESGYIFTKTGLPNEYRPSYRCQFIENSLIHYYRGSNWSESDPRYHESKLGFIIDFLNDPESYGLVLDDRVSYGTAHSDKGYNGIDHNYRDYRFIDESCLNK